MIPLRLVAELARPFVAAASGLLLQDKTFCVVADDDLSLFRFRLNPLSGRRQKLFPGELPTEKKARKALKPDFESLVNFRNGILCLPSGSTPQRRRAALVQGRTVELLDLTSLFRKLEKEFAELNVEGAVALEDRLRLFQRGNGKRGENATVDVDLDLKKILAVRSYELGAENGVPYSFTDAAGGADGIWFLAVAEDSQDTYLDGAVVGSALGKLSATGELQALRPLALTGKPEGLCLEGNSFYVVTDDDDPSKPARLLKGRLPKI